MNKVILAGVIAALSTSTVLAADLILPTVISDSYSPSAYSWTGFYAGANVGYGWGEVESGGASFDELEGLLGGIQAGYNYDFGGFVLGVEGDVQISDISYEETIGGVTARAGLDSFGTLRARAGLAVDRFMPYVTGGLAVGYAEVEASAGGVSVATDDTYIGWTAGGGVEAAITDNVTIKAEYLYADFGDADFDAGVDIGLTAHIARVGLNYKF